MVAVRLHIIGGIVADLKEVLLKSYLEATYLFLELGRQAEVLFGVGLLAPDMSLL